MKDSIYKNNIWKVVALSLVGFFAILSGLFFSPNMPLVAGLILISVAVLLYVLEVIYIAERNWLDIRAVFTGVWLGTIGLATLRLTDYQEPWLQKTWILLAVAYLMFQIGANLGISKGEKCSEKAKNLLSRIKVKGLSFKLQEKRLFPICIITTFIGFVSFAINVMIRGYIPAFSDSTSAYMDFYTKFHVFAVAATAVSGLCYYCIKMQSLSKIKKAILWACIFYLVILFPILVVSRGVFIVAALSLTTTIFYLNKRKLYVFIICLVVIAGVYLFTSQLRGYTDAQLDALFEPSNVTIGIDSEQGKTEGTENEQQAADKNEQQVIDENEQQVTDENGQQTTESVDEEKNISFALPPKMAFLYGYLTVSHDNFNEAVEHTVGYTWGARQFYPFNVILRIQAVTDMIASGESHVVRPHLRTVNMIGTFYYDFHEWGVILCTLFWAFIFGMVQGYHTKSKGLFSLFVLGFVMCAVALSFFSSWVDSFELWMFCGVILIITIVTCIRVETN